MPAAAAVVLATVPDPDDRDEVVAELDRVKGGGITRHDSATLSPTALNAALAVNSTKVVVLDCIETLLPDSQKILKDFLVSPRGTKPLVVAMTAESSARPDPGRFDPLLWAVLATHIIAVPPLRRRPHDVKTMARSILSAKKPGWYFDHAVLELLAMLSWRGHRRELTDTIHYLAEHITSPAPPITVADSAPLLMTGDCPLCSRAGWLSTAVAPSRIDRFLSLTGNNAELVAHLLGLPRSSVFRRVSRH